MQAFRDATAAGPRAGCAPVRATYTTDEVAARAGLHPDSVRAAAARGEFPAPLRVGGKLLWPRAAVDAFLSGAGFQVAAAIPGGEMIRTAAKR